MTDPELSMHELKLISNGGFLVINHASIRLMAAKLIALDAENHRLKSDIQNKFIDTHKMMDWLSNPNRKSAIVSFTEGNERQLAYKLESLIQHKNNGKNNDPNK